MCEYCGCQNIDVIAELTAEHLRLRELGRDLETAARADDVGSARAAASAMRSVLAVHTAVEEIGLFPMLDGDFGERMAGLVEEHRVIEADIAEVASACPQVGWEERARRAVSGLFEHILKEQDGVFPAALASLSARQWEAVEEVRRRIGSTVVPASPIGASAERAKIG